MKKSSTILIGMLFVLILTSPARSEMGLNVGIRLGTNLATVNGDDAENFGLLSDVSADVSPHYLVGGNAGIVATLSFTGNFSVQAEILYSMRGGEWELSETNDGVTGSIIQWIRLNYFEIPVLIRYNLPTPGKISPYFYGGGSVAFYSSGEFQLEARYKMDGTTIYYDKIYYDKIYNATGTQLGLVFGSGVKLKAGKISIFFEPRYTIGLSNMFDDVDNPDEISEDEAVLIDPATGEGSKLKHGFFTFSFGISYYIGL